jgi:hypothetical protein
MNQCYLLNAIPGGLIPADGITLRVIPCSAARVGRKLRSGEVLSAVGHADTAALIGALVGAPCAAARISVPALVPGDHHLLALYQGPRLPEGATTLPEGASLAFYELFADD